MDGVNNGRDSTMTLTSPTSPASPAAGTMTVAARSRDLERALDNVKASRPAAVHVLQLTDDPNTDGRHLAEAIDREPIMAAQILRLANSAAFGMSRRVASTQHAVSVVGFDSVRAVAAILASGLRNHKTPTPDGFWNHCAATAAACSVISSRFGMSRGEAFSLGLLHDLGAAILCSVDPLGYKALCDSGSGTREDTASRCAQEIAMYGMSHAEAGARLFASWSFPELFVDAVANHHDVLVGLSPHERVLLAGDALAHLVLQPSGLVEVDPTQLETLGISSDALPGVTALTIDYATDVLASLPNV